MGEGGKVQNEQNRCDRVCCEELHLTLCHWERYLELRNRVEYRYSSMDGTRIWLAGMIEDKKTHANNFWARQRI